MIINIKIIKYNLVNLSKKAEFSSMVFELIDDLNGSFSAEHGIGILRLDEMSRYKNATEIEMMTRIKDALDPHGVLNPGKVVPRY